MQNILENYESKLLRRVLYFLCFIYAFMFFIAAIIQMAHLKNGFESSIFLYVRIISFIINLSVGLGLYFGIIHNSNIAKAGIIFLIFNFISSRLNSYWLKLEYNIAVLDYLSSVIYLMIFSMFTKKSRYLVIVSVIFFSAYIFIYIIYNEAIFGIPKDGFLNRKIVYFLGAFFLFSFITIFIINQYLNNSLHKYLESSSNYIKKIAFHDHITGLMNGLGLEHHIKDIFSNIDSQKEIGVLLGLRFVGITFLNETLGYNETNKWLINFSSEIESACKNWARSKSEFNKKTKFTFFRPEPSIYIFPLIMKKLDNNIEYIIKETLPETIQKVLNKSELGYKLRFLGAYVIHPDDAVSIPELQGNLLNTLHEAKRMKKEYSKFIPFNADTHNENLRKKQLIDEMNIPGFEKNISAFFQPKIEAHSNNCTCFEALARWNHPELGQIQPSEFIPISESCSKILLITMKILNDTKLFIDNLLKTPNTSKKEIRVSFNLSPLLLQLEILKKLGEYITKHNIAKHLEVEITESILLKNTEELKSFFKSWRKEGIKFSIDDFGTGYSNLSYLQNFEVDILKIDKQFINNLPNNKKNAKLVKAIILMAKSLDMKIIAEGVELQEQAELLKELGCDGLQGYLYAKPMNFNDALKYFDTHK